MISINGFSQKFELSIDSVIDLEIENIKQEIYPRLATRNWLV